MAECDLTHDKFLNGQLRLWQPKRGFRAGVDAVFLAASVPAVAGQDVLELGCGVGTALLCLGRRVSGLSLTGIEVQPEYASLAVRNGAEAGQSPNIVQADLRDLPIEIRTKNYDHVLANPPYYQRTRGSASPLEGRETALGEAAPLSEWLDVAMRRLRPKGQLTMIQRADRLPDILSALDDRAGDVQLLPLSARPGRAARLVLLRATKGARGPFTLLPPLILHDGPQHDADRDSYVPEIRAVLRDGAALPWPVPN